MLLTSARNIAQLTATFEPFFAETQQAQVDMGPPHECTAADWSCDAWPVNCGLNNSIERSCNRIGNCTDGYTPLLIKSCVHLGNPQRYSVWSVCRPELMSDPEHFIRIEGTITDERNNPIASSYVWLTDPQNSRVYLEALTDNDGRYVLLLDANTRKYSNTVVVHTAPVTQGYGGNIGSISHTPQCAGIDRTTADEESWVTLDDTVYGLISSTVTFAETTRTIALDSDSIQANLTVHLLID